MRAIVSKRHFVGAHLGVVLALASVATGWAQSSRIAQVETVSGQVFIERTGSRLTVKIGDPVDEKDVIETGADGSIGITFIDNTVMSAGPNTEVSLDNYRFDSNKFNGSMLADLRKGTLSMVSGDIAKSSPGAMKVKTPAAILGVRGTHFAVFVVQVPK
jgi:hypothetical protein